MTPEQFVYGIVQDCHARALFCGEKLYLWCQGRRDPRAAEGALRPAGGGGRGGAYGTV